ncbi:MAG: peptidoglycan DD-metalloendopeptidase family protein [Candidatus Parcubacteria bacterium]|nr:peptidoglycan DD-metalloendopeptidase family protein [Candidatus Parcubacteria bacterium]
MKLYHVYKKQLSKIFFLSLLIIFIFLPTVFSLAQNISELQQKISQKDSDIQQLEKEIVAYQIQLDGIGQQKNSLAKSIKELDITRKKLNADISVTQKKIDKTNLKIQSLSSDIKSKQSSITNDIESIRLQIRNTNEIEMNNVLETLLSEDDFTAMWNEVDNIATVREQIRKKIKELKQIKGELEDTRDETIKAKNELTVLKNKLSDQQKIIVQNTNEKNRLLKQTKNNEANYQKLLKNRIAEKDALEKELRDYESQLKYTLDPSKLPNKGIFSWPLDYILITQQFGKTVDAKRLYVSGSHGGVDFRATVGTPVKAMADGVVMGVGDTDRQCPGTSFGRFIFIKQDNGLSIAYGHLSLVRANVGERVSRGQIVAYSGNSGYSTAPHLHVTVYAPNAAEVKSIPSKSCPGRVLTQPIAPLNAYLDPLYYLPSTNKSMFK